MLDLKSCPFCGGEATHRRFTGNGFTLARVEYTQVSCQKCRIETEPDQPLGNEDRAATAWNRRTLQAVGPEPAVAVKPLAWNERGYAHTGNGTLYWVTRQTDFWLLDKITGSSHFKSSYPSEETAKANAEADYASRIRSALVPTPPAEPVVEAKEPEAVADEIRALSKRLLSLSEELDPHLPSTHDPAFIDDLRYGADILLSLATIDSFYARSAFKAGWRTNADNVTHDRDYMDGCEEADWQEFLARGLRKYLEYVAQPSDEAALATPPAERVVEALPPTREYVDRIVRIFRDRPADDTSAVVLQDYARAALAAKDGRS